MLTEALELAAHGFRVHPLYPFADGVCACGHCNSAGKHPRLPHWPSMATDQRSLVELWWGRYPEDGIGIATGRGTVVVDLDGAAGIEAWERDYNYTTGLVAETGGG